MPNHKRHMRFHLAKMPSPPGVEPCCPAILAAGLSRVRERGDGMGSRVFLGVFDAGFDGSARGDRPSLHG